MFDIPFDIKEFFGTVAMIATSFGKFKYMGIKSTKFGCGNQ